MVDFQVDLRDLTCKPDVGISADPVLWEMMQKYTIVIFPLIWMSSLNFNVGLSARQDIASKADLPCVTAATSA
jgi:hypothetical protein